MDWRKHLQSSLEEELQDDEWDEYFLSFMIEDIIEPSQIKRGKHGGSRPGRGANLDREREELDQRLWKDYFAEPPVYGPQLFRRRYRMRRSLFVRIVDSICAQDPYFVQKRDAIGMLGLSATQKCTAVLRMLSLGICADATDEYCRLGESTAMESMKRFCRGVRAAFEGQYLRQPTREYILKQLEINRASLCRPFMSLKEKHVNIMLACKKELARTLSDALEFYRQDLLSFRILVVNGIWTPLMTS
jgi:hypothetical protein